MYFRIFRPKGSRLYRVRYKLSNGPRLYDEPLRTHLKEVAVAKGRQLLQEQEMELVGLAEPRTLREAAQRPLTEHHQDYVAALVARGRSKDYLIHSRGRLQRLFAQCRWKYLRDLRADSLEQWISRQHGFSSKTLAEYVAHAKGFASWLERQGRLPTNPFRRIEPIPTRGRETFKRRALKVTEFVQLLGKAPPRRRVAYAIAGLTGLRRSELKHLLWADVHLDDTPPWIELRASTTKSRRAATLFIVPQLEAMLRPLRGEGAGPVLPQGVPGNDLLTRDLLAAGIPVEDERGWRVDFHALRHTYASLLGAAGVPEAARVRMVRHTEWRQTDHYTDPSSVPLRAGAEQLSALLAANLPSSGASPKMGKRREKTGTRVHGNDTQDKAVAPNFPPQPVDPKMETNGENCSVPERENLPLASPRGFEPRFSP